MTKIGNFCKNKKKIGDLCSLHYEKHSDLNNKNKNISNVLVSIDTPLLCNASTKTGQPCKNKIKKGNRLYCQVHSTAK